MVYCRIDVYFYIDVIWYIECFYLNIRDERILYWMKVLGMGKRRLGMMWVNIYLVYFWMRRRDMRGYGGFDFIFRNILEFCMIDRYWDMILMYWVVYLWVIIWYFMGG